MNVEGTVCSGMGSWPERFSRVDGRVSSEVK